MSKKDQAKAEEAQVPAAQPQGGAVSTNVMDLADMAKEASQGFTGVTQEDVAIPFLVILQSLSPQVKRGHAAKVEGAEEGDIFNTVTKQVFKGSKGLTVVPCAFQKRWVEWKLREAGGGFVKSHDTDEILKQTARNDRNQDLLPSGHQIVTTAYHYVLVVHEDGTFERVVIGMSSTQLKKSRGWLSRMMGLQAPLPGGGSFNPPMFGQSYFVTTGIETKDNNQWYGWVFDRPQLLQRKDLYVAAKQFAEDVSKSRVQAATPPDEGTGEASSGAPVDNGNM